MQKEVIIEGREGRRMRTFKKGMMMQNEGIIEGKDDAEGRAL